MEQSKQKYVFMAIAVIAAFYFMPLVGVILLLMLFHLKFKELMWRLQMAILIFMAVFFTGLYLSHSMNGFMSWFLR